MKRLSSGGFTVIEALFTMLIFSLVLSGLAYSLSMLSRVSLARKDFGFELEALQLTQLIRDDARNASQVSASAGSLVFVGQDGEKSLADRLEVGLNAPGSLSTVRYEFVDGWLYRSKSTELRTEKAPVYQLASFEVEQEGRLARVRFSSEKSNKTESFETVVQLP